MSYPGRGERFVVVVGRGFAVDLWTEQKSVRYGGWVRAVAWPGICASEGADSSIQASSQLGRSAFGSAP